VEGSINMERPPRRSVKTRFRQNRSSSFRTRTVNGGITSTSASAPGPAEGHGF
jgi:hypothetical protein